MTAFRVRTWREKSERRKSARKFDKRANFKPARQRENKKNVDLEGGTTGGLGLKFNCGDMGHIFAFKVT